MNLTPLVEQFPLQVVFTIVAWAVLTLATIWLGIRRAHLFSSEESRRVTLGLAIVAVGAFAIAKLFYLVGEIKYAADADAALNAHAVGWLGQRVIDVCNQLAQAIAVMLTLISGGIGSWMLGQAIENAMARSPVPLIPRHLSARPADVDTSTPFHRNSEDPPAGG